MANDRLIQALDDETLCAEVMGFSARKSRSFRSLPSRLWQFSCSTAICILEVEIAKITSPSGTNLLHVMKAHDR